MSRGDRCLIDDNLINYCSNITYNSAPKTYVYLRSNEEKVDKNVCCFYDGYPIEKEIVGLPKKLQRDGKFIVWGYFCSFECARSFIVDNFTSCHQGKETSLLALLAIKTYGVNFRLNRAPDKFLLEKFGGPLSIEEWRKENLSNHLWVIRTPNIERTCSAYECYLNQDNTKNYGTQVKNRQVNEIPKDTKLIISKRTTPAHFTKKSLLTLVQKS